MQKRSYILEELSWPEARDAFAADDLVIIPVGSTEEHGPQSPLGTDFYIARALAEEIGRKAKALVAPAIPIGNAQGLLDYAGTISIDPGLLTDLLYEIGSDLADNGARRLLFINGHGGNNSPIRVAADRLYWERDVFSVSSEWWQLMPQISPFNTHDHGGKSETSLMMLIDESIVDMTQAKTVQITQLTERIGFDYGFILEGAHIGISLPVSAYAANGNFGDPSEEANLKWGTDVFDFYTDYMAAFVEALRAVPAEKLSHGKDGAR
jgi:creatinine amidohydrolase